MTVSSTISVFCRDGVFRTVYCHLHGAPTWNGRILHTHYATGQQAEALVEHGDIRCLGPRCDKPAGHTLQNPVDGVTAYYGRDSGFRMDSEAREYRSFREAIATESTEEVRFHYVFIDGYWKVMYRTPEGWKMYLGPSQHWEDDAYIPAIHDAQVWRCNCRTGNGITPDFGAHDVDTVQWAFGVDRSGPVAIENARFSDWLEPREILSWANTFSFDLVYADGRRCHVKSYDPKRGEPRSVTFNGSVGKKLKKKILFKTQVQIV